MGVTIVGPDVQSVTACPFCGAPFISMRAAQYTCAREGCLRARMRKYERERMRDPSRVRAARARNREWAAAHRGCSHRQEWLLGEPPHGLYLPGGGCELFVSPLPKYPMVHRNVRGLHGALSALIGGHDYPAEDERRARWPQFSLVPWPRGTLGWGIYWRSDRGVALASATINGALWDRPTAFRFGPLVKVRAPVIARRGRQRIAIETITPVSISGMGRTVHYDRPDKTSLHSAITKTLPGRCGLLDSDVEGARLEIVSIETMPARVDLGGKYGTTIGWEGRTIVEVNAVARWLLEAAARGPGLGSRTAFGFGRVRVTAC